MTTDQNNLSYDENIINKIILHPAFNDTIKELGELKIELPEFGTEGNWDLSLIPFPKSGDIIANIGDIKAVKLDPNIGQDLLNLNYPILAYDESFQDYNALEGVAYFFSHAIVVHGEDDYIPSIFICFYFFTRSELISQQSKNIIETDNPSVASKLKYVEDRAKFFLNVIPEKSIILIDGPLIGGQISSHTIKLNKQLLKKDIIPVFIVKNSNSNLITKYISELKGKFNSDMHWCYNILKPGERTNFFQYVDKHNPSHGKVFCYLKPFDGSPQRIEVHIDTYKKHQRILDKIMDLIYYLILAQGNLKNPQVRTVAIAEQYARQSLKLFNVRSLMRKIGLKPTINESRFKGG